jgi:c-di-GMP-binding flagellar brake protein YcgR
MTSQPLPAVKAGPSGNRASSGGAQQARDQRSPRKAIKRRAVALIRGRSFDAQTIEISETGLMLEIEGKAPALPERHGLVLNFHLSPEDFISARVEVVTIYPGEKGSGIRYGLKFVGVGMAIKRAIRNYIAGNFAKAA